MKQLLCGLDYLFSKRVIHRDLKSQNVLISKNGDVKIADYGLSRMMELDGRPYTNNVVSLWNRAPEILLGSPDYSQAIDMWALGCIFYELVNKTAPFQGKSEIDQIGQILDSFGVQEDTRASIRNRLPNLEGVAKKPCSALARLPKWFKGTAGLDLMMQMLTLNPEKRIKPKDALAHGFFDC